MALEDFVRKLREDAISQKRNPIPDSFKGVTKARIRYVLGKIDRVTNDLVEAVFALLDDQQPSWFHAAAAGTKFCDGASTAHIACHVGILQRGDRKLDREGRDYWIKPLREVGAIEAITLMPGPGTFVAGHVVAKSSNSAYRLAPSFVEILMSTETDLDRAMNAWIAEKAVRRRLEFQASLAEQARRGADTKHSNLISDACGSYVRRFLPGYEVLYVDDGDGDRIPDGASARIQAAGLELKLEDAMPDVLLWDSFHDTFWVIEAVTSDGEVELHKVDQIRKLVNRTKSESHVGFTTVYRTWYEAAQRQGKHKNLPPGTYLWILEDASKQFFIESCEKD
jgi:hypothetical protein